MTADMEEQEDELLALHSIFDSDEFVRKESKFAGEIRVSVELPAGFTVRLKEGETLRQYEISFLPCLYLTFDLPEDYPSSSPPSFTLTCSWLTDTQLSALSAQLTDLYSTTGGAVVLFSWIQFLKEDALRFLDIHSVLELPSDEHSTQNDSEHTPRSGPSNQSSDPSAPSLEVEHPMVMPADRQDPSTSDRSSTDSQTSLPPSSSSDPLQGAASQPVHPRDPPQNETLSGLSLTPSQALLSQLLIHNQAQKQKAFSTTVFDCGVCFVGCLGSDCVLLPECGHIFCRACLGEFCKVQITEGNVKGVTCPEPDCPATPTPAQVRRLVGEEMFTRYDRLLLQSTLDSMADVVYCPRRSCGSAVIVDKSSSAALCSVCAFAFCVNCRKTYHGTSDCRSKRNMKILEAQGANADLPQSQEGLKALWDDYASGSKERRRLLESRYGRNIMRGSLGDCLSENWIVSNSKNCPHCFRRIEKNGGCNMMTCSQCGQRFCWACLGRLGQGRSGHLGNSPCPLYPEYPDA